jgi:hypothetical protein
VRVVTQGGRIDDRFVVVDQLAEEPKRLRLRELGQPDVVELDLECIRLVMKRSHRAIEVFVKKAQGLGRGQPVLKAGEGRFPQIADRCAAACACGRLVKEDEEQPHLEQFRSSAVQVRDALLDSVVRDGLRACGCADRRNGAFDDVLIDVPMLVKQSERCLQAVNDGGALGVRQAFVVDAPQPIGYANVAGLRQERRVIDEAPERNEAVHATGVFVVPKDTFHAQHDTTSTSNGWCLPGSYLRRVFDDERRIRSMSGSRRVAHNANPYRPKNMSRPARNE